MDISNYLLNTADKCCNYKTNNVLETSPNNVIRILPSNNRPLNNTPFIDNNEFLYTNEYCLDNKTIVSNWKFSRVFGNKKKIIASLNPIKHWRRQLIPRQLYYIDELNDNELNNLLNINKNSNIINQNRSNKEKIRYVMDYPGASNIINIEYLLSLKTNSKKLSLQLEYSSDYISKNIEKDINCQKLMIQEDSTKLSCKKKSRVSKANYQYDVYFYENSNSYLESRVKLFTQNNRHINLNITKSFLPFLIKKNKNDNSISENKNFLASQQLINKNIDCDLLLNCHCYKEISFKPFNPSFTSNNAVSISNLIIKKKRNVLTKNQYNITNKWGTENNEIPFKSKLTTCCKKN